MFSSRAHKTKQIRDIEICFYLDKLLAILDSIAFFVAIRHLSDASGVYWIV